MKKRSGNVPTSGSKRYHSLTTPFQKWLDFLGFCYSLSLGVFRLLASMQRFESARRLHFLLDFIRQPGAHLLERVLRLSTKKKKEAENFGGEA